MKYIYLLIFVLSGTLASAQKGASIGDVVPNITLNAILNYPTTTSKLADFRGKLLILDFWATWCQPCVAAFPKIDSLKKQFKDQIEILPVTDESKDKVADFLNRYQKTKKVKVPSVTEDTQLKSIFKFSYLPHTVWIDKDGRILAISEGKHLTAENIKNYLATGELKLPLKKDESVNIMADPPGFVMMPGFNMIAGNETKYAPIPESQHKLHTVLTGYVPGLGFGGSSGDSVSVNVTNTTIKWLYRIALWKNSVAILNENTTIVDIKDATLYETIVGRKFNDVPLVESGQDYLNWLQKNGYCYEIRVPENMIAAKFDIMINDLNNYFGALYGIEGGMEKRKSKYLALTRIAKSDKMATKGGRFAHTQTKVSLQITNYKMATVLALLAQPLQNYPPIEDETGYTGNVDLDLNCELSDLKSLNVELGKYGLALIEKEKMMEVAVVRQKKK